MAQLRRDGPYIWITWLTKLLAGENSCEWASWFRAQHEGSSWKKVPNTFDFAGWQINHTAMLSEVRQEWEEDGYSVFSENQNSFVLKGQQATVGGKPDLIARKGNSGVIIDVKTGKAQPSHTAQVMLYMYAVPKVLGQYGGVCFDGKVVYTNHEVDIPASSIDETFVGNVASLVHRLASNAPARRVPSSMECGFCPITSEDCAERATDDEPAEGVTEDF